MAAPGWGRGLDQNPASCRPPSAVCVLFVLELFGLLRSAKLPDDTDIIAAELQRIRRAVDVGERSAASRRGEIWPKLPARKWAAPLDDGPVPARSASGSPRRRGEGTGRAVAGLCCRQRCGCIKRSHSARSAVRQSPRPVASDVAGQRAVALVSVAVFMRAGCPTSASAYVRPRT